MYKRFTSFVGFRFRSHGVAAALASVAFLLAGANAFASTTSNLLPLADGNYTQWTPLTGTSHFAMVNESVCNGTTNYNSTTVVGNRDSYVVATSTIPVGATITQIAIRPCASRVSTGGVASVLNVFYRFGGVNSSDSGSYSLSGTTPTDLATTTFSGLTLLNLSSSSIEIGGVLTSGTKGARLSRIATIVTYSPQLAPSGLTGVATTTSAIQVSWTNNNAANVLGFVLQRSPDAVNWANIATTTASTTAYYDSGLSTNTAYSYRVDTYNAAAYSGWSNIASATTTDTIPADPSNLSLSKSTGTSTTDITLTWNDNSSNETAFSIDRSVGTSSFFHLATTTANVTSYIDHSLPANTYTYRLRAYNSGGFSGWSNSASTTTP